VCTDIRVGKRLLITGAFATWCFLNTWVELAEGRHSYFARFDPRTTVALPVVCLEALVAVAMLAAWAQLARFRERRLPHLLFLACCLVPAGVAGVALLRASPVDLVPLVRNRVFWPVALVLGLAPAAYAWFRPRAASTFMRHVFCYSWPVLLVVLFHAVREGLPARGPEFADGKPAVRAGTGAAARRVVWIVFDELSRSVVFESRPASLLLPNFDRLRAGSFHAASALSPSGFTETTMPALILGEKVTSATPAGPATLLLRTDRHPEPFGWHTRQNVFDTARDLGYNTALAGWFHPYGRVLNRSLTESFWVAGWLNIGIEEPGAAQSFLANVLFRARIQLSSLPLVGHLPGVFPGLPARREKIDRFRRLMEHAGRIAADPSIGLALLHLTEPHPPPVYSRERQALAPERRNSYLDSVAYADRVLGELRSAMERRGVWDRTVVIVSSDHGWRPDLWRGDAEWTAEDQTLVAGGVRQVPFLVKMAGQRTPVEYAMPFDTVVTRALITRILAGELTAPEQLPAAIEQASANPIR
jgi:hypothetical protein